MIKVIFKNDSSLLLLVWKLNDNDKKFYNINVFIINEKKN